MAVDANILVFERMKEEVRRGNVLSRAAESGFSRAWTSVRDSNIATLLTCLILYMFGSAFAASLVKGFAITLALGTLINLFTAIVVTRTLIRVIFGALETQLQLDRGCWGLGGAMTNFVQRRKLFFTIAGILILLSVGCVSCLCGAVPRSGPAHQH